MDNLGWAQELISAPDLEAAGSVIDRRLQIYASAGVPQTEDRLVERVAYEHQVRHFMARANERGYAFPARFERFATNWVDFVDQNKAAETELARRDRQQVYERGRTDATTAAARGWLPPTPSLPAPAAPTTAPAPITLSDAVHQTLDALVKIEVAKRVAGFPAPAPVRVDATRSDAPPLAPAPAEGLRLSQALARYLAPPGKKRRRKTRGRADTAAIVQFAIDLLGDPLLEAITVADWNRLDEAMTDIPLRKNIPDTERSLFARYQYAQQHGWENLSRVSVTTIEKRYHDGLEKFIHWAIDESLYLGKPPKFECIDEENTAALPRDAFDDEELIALIKLPLFTGCAGDHRIWKPGKYFVQHHLYWGYLILIFTGMRPGEVGQLNCADLVTDGVGNWFFDLRPFDARKGRVALKDMRNLKTNAAGRVVPIHPLLIELGLLDRVRELEAIGEKRLFPEWEKFTRGDGTVRWSQPMTKSWQYIKQHILKIERADLTLYGLRHLMAEWLDDANIAQRTRNRILGHATSVPERYGRKGAQTREQISAIEAAEPAVVKRMREILTTAKAKADRGDLIVLKPWLTAKAAG